MSIRVYQSAQGYVLAVEGSRGNARTRGMDFVGLFDIDKAGKGVARMIEESMHEFGYFDIGFHAGLLLFRASGGLQCAK